MHKKNKYKLNFEIRKKYLYLNSQITICENSFNIRELFLKCNYTNAYASGELRYSNYGLIAQLARALP